MALIEVEFRRVGNRIIQMLGGDRELVMFTGLLAAVLVIAAQDMISAIVGTFLWFGALWVLRLMGKKDPQMRFVYLRSLRYRPYYPPRSTPFRVNDVRQGNQYK
ncbi:hypothetical protein LMG7143_04428 [Ralstonia thomasii]|jgi:type IV secretory pathway TrbD component|uniref:conjugal transfer protein TrbD n=1 Tax=Ralstonia TaxID=48736 RepID=UPI000BD0E2F6|nr:MULTISPECIES: conjugal transfer protein TrbD [Ralstonia]MBT2180960.1 conjugal transfer protein TrbD [Ralstonia pickettii]POH90098.1 conjugal transfer protein TrbD [Ralstonia pickettii]CAJ0718502.1 hypothetical protein LMG7143_04428 [Ralstonia sp. LMG 18095]HBI8627008.1 conjugal transfer protein TrbD [Escherichia coli]